jgi:hypothetical protein
MKSTLYLLSIIFLYGCNSPSHHEPILTKDEYDVIVAVIKDYFPNGIDPFKRSKLNSLYIYHKTIYSRNSDDDKYARWTGAISKKDTSVSLKWFSTSGEWNSLDSNFVAISHDTIDIDVAKLVLPIDSVLMSNDERCSGINKICMGFSRVGFNPKRNEALICYQLHRFEHDEIFLLLLKKENNHWSIANGYGSIGILSTKTYYRAWRPLIAAP